MKFGVLSESGSDLSKDGLFWKLSTGQIGVSGRDVIDERKGGPGQARPSQAKPSPGVTSNAWMELEF